MPRITRKPMCLTVFVLALATADRTASAEDSLPALLREFFTAPTIEERTSIEKRILAEKSLNHKKLAKAIRALQLWEPQKSGEFELTVRLRKGKSSEKRLIVRIPDGYDPGKKWPLIIALHGRGAKPESMLRGTVLTLGDHRDEYIVVAPDRLGAMISDSGDERTYNGAISFTFPYGVVAQPRLLLEALRRKYHIDSDRVYLMGFSLGGHNTWMAGVMHSDCFAGIMPLATPMQVVGGDALYEELLANLRNLPIVFSWGEKDTLDAKGNPDPSGGNAGISRMMAAVMQALGLDDFRGVEMAGAGHQDVVPPPAEFDWLLNRARRHYPKTIHQAFRLPQQSDAYWVSADALQCEPLSGETINVQFKPGEDPKLATRRFLVSRLGLIEATCKAQSIDLRTRNVGHVNLLLSDELLDLDKPIRINRGKKELFSGKVERDLRVMLREAARGWDFDRLPSVRVVVPVAGKVKFGYEEGRSKSSKSK
ncbi:MAG: hypothetical protein KF841_08190 [Phycisphaerae bacterium]|nr:hypothetical protein [Phycisphaerae bacterium]